jgi:hypothetical protein
MPPLGGVLTMLKSRKKISRQASKLSTVYSFLALCSTLSYMNQPSELIDGEGIGMVITSSIPVRRMTGRL